MRVRISDALSERDDRGYAHAMETRRAALQLAWIVCAFAIACSPNPNETEVPTAPVERGRIERIVVATGTVEPQNEVEVRPRLAGIIEQIHVEAGDKVERGAALIQLERELIDAQVREAQAAVRATEVERRYAKIAFERSAGLKRSGATSDRLLDEARARMESAEASVARAAANLERLQVQQRYAQIEAPLTGTVLDVFVEEGNAVSPVTAVTGGSLLLSIAGAESMHLEGLIDENEIARVAVGQVARIRTEAFGERIFEGRVRKIAPLGQRVQNVTYFEAEIEITDPEAHLLRPRMSGDAEIVTETVEDALHVPETALRYRGDTLYVEVPSENADASVEERTISIGIVDGDRVQILDGLASGEVVRLQ